MEAFLKVPRCFDGCFPTLGRKDPNSCPQPRCETRRCFTEVVGPKHLQVQLRRGRDNSDGTEEDILRGRGKEMRFFVEKMSLNQLKSWF